MDAPVAPSPASCFDRVGAHVVDDALVAVAHQPPHEVGAHPAEADHPELHPAPLVRDAQLARCDGGCHHDWSGARRAARRRRRISSFVTLERAVVARRTLTATASPGRRTLVVGAPLAGRRATTRYATHVVGVRADEVAVEPHRLAARRSARRGSRRRCAHRTRRGRPRPGDAARTPRSRSSTSSSRCDGPFVAAISTPSSREHPPELADGLRRVGHVVRACGSRPTVSTGVAASGSVSACSDRAVDVAEAWHGSVRRASSSIADRQIGRASGAVPGHAVAGLLQMRPGHIRLSSTTASRFHSIWRATQANQGSVAVPYLGARGAQRRAWCCSRYCRIAE